MRGVLQINWVGSAIFTLFVCTFGFYLWVRITKTLDLGSYLAYGIFVLVVEVRPRQLYTLLSGSPALSYLRLRLLHAGSLSPMFRALRVEWGVEDAFRFLW